MGQDEFPQTIDVGRVGGNEGTTAGQLRGEDATAYQRPVGYEDLVCHAVGINEFQTSTPVGTTGTACLGNDAEF